MKLQLNRLNRYNFQLKLFHTAVTMKLVKVIENGMNTYSSMSSIILQSLTFITFIVSEKIATLKFSAC